MNFIFRQTTFIGLVALLVMLTLTCSVLYVQNEELISADNADAHTVPLDNRALPESPTESTGEAFDNENSNESLYSNVAKSLLFRSIAAVGLWLVALSLPSDYIQRIDYPPEII